MAALFIKIEGKRCIKSVYSPLGLFFVSLCHSIVRSSSSTSLTYCAAIRRYGVTMSNKTDMSIFTTSRLTNGTLWNYKSKEFRAR